MNLKNIAIAVTTTLLPITLATIINVFGPGRNYDFNSGFILTLIILSEVIALFGAYCFTFDKSWKPGAFVLTGFTIVILSLHLNVYQQRNLYKGGDVDPIAYLHGKTRHTGGYNYLVDKETYRQYTVSDKKFLHHPFQTHILLGHIPSIAKVEDQLIGSKLSYVANRHAQVTMSLVDAVIYIPFDEVKLKQFFTDHQIHGITPSIGSIVASELGKFSDPVLAPMKYPPAGGWFTRELPANPLGELEELYGFRIVTLSGKQPRLVFTLSYPYGSNSDQMLFNENYWPPKDPVPVPATE